jgi:hypothetical protein
LRPTEENVEGVLRRLLDHFGLNRNDGRCDFRRCGGDGVLPALRDLVVVRDHDTGRLRRRLVGRTRAADRDGDG